MKIRLTPFCSLWLLFVFAAGSLSLSAALPDRSGVLKRRKDFEISKFISPLYRQYVDDLTKLQAQYIAAKKFGDARQVQEEVQRNIGYVQQLGKSYQFIFAALNPLPKEGHLLRAARNAKIKESIGNILNQYLVQQNKQQAFHLKGREFQKANAVQEEVKNATNQLSRTRGIDSRVAWKNIPGDAKEFRGHRYKFFKAKVTWHEAKMKCEKMGGHLAIVDDAEENKFLTGLLGKARGAFIGATKADNDGEWLWVNGKKMTYSNWDRKPVPSYLALANVEKGSFRSHGAVSQWPLGFICEWE